MPRVKRGTHRRAKRKKLLKRAKGFYATKSKLYQAAQEAVDKALNYAYSGRRRKKRDFRRLWVVRINAAARAQRPDATASSSAASRPPASGSIARASPSWPSTIRPRSRASPSRRSRRSRRRPREPTGTAVGTRLARASAARPRAPLPVARAS